jgi:hypothetical protein|tara:strand:+ start:196 stop:501 length:306 start_codon:yes stop_codon:yes gene_type:complete
VNIIVIISEEKKRSLSCSVCASTLNIYNKEFHSSLFRIFFGWFLMCCPPQRKISKQTVEENISVLDFFKIPRTFSSNCLYKNERERRQGTTVDDVVVIVAE